MAEDFVQETLVRVLDNLASYEGRSRFTTWAQKIAIRVALTELRRKRWRDVSLDATPSTGAGRSYSDSPAELLERADTVGWIKQLMDEELTEKQRTAIRAVAFVGLPLEEVARRMDTNRNALYKLIHDARKKLKERLAREGVRVDELLEAMETT